MKFKIIIVFVALSTVIFSCSDGFGNLVKGKGLKVYYPNKKDEQLASDLAFYWKNNQFLGKEEQTLRLVHEKNKYQIQLIPSDDEVLQNLSFNEKKLLFGLKDSLNSSVFRNTDGCEIMFCTKGFSPIINLNDL